jgi:hypothetical protein
MWSFDMWTVIFWVAVIYGYFKYEEAMKKEESEMLGWSVKKLHAYAGVESHRKRLKDFAYKTAKEKAYMDAK